MLEKIDLDHKINKKAYKRFKPEFDKRFTRLQNATWSAKIPVIIVLEGWHAAGKGAILQKLTRPLDARGFCYYFPQPSTPFEVKYPWMRQFWLNLPSRGEWAFFERSWYSRVLDERIQQLIPEKNWRRAYRDIVEFERTLTDDNYQIFKFLLHINKQEQRSRYNKFMKNSLTPKQITDNIWEQQRHHDEWTNAFEEILERTETEWAPWTIIGATNQRYALIKILETMTISLENKLGWPYSPLPTLDDYETTISEAIDNNILSDAIETDTITEDIPVSEIILQQEETNHSDKG